MVEYAGQPNQLAAGFAPNLYAPQMQTGQAIAQLKPPSVLDTHADRLHSHAQEVEMLAQRMHFFADRIFGLRPQNEAKGTNVAPPAPDCALWKLNAAQERMERARASLQDAVNRLEAL